MPRTPSEPTPPPIVPLMVAQVLELPMPGKLACAGWWYLTDDRKPHDSHHLRWMPLALRPVESGPYRREPSRHDIEWNRKIEEWAAVKTGRVCDTCWAVYDPTRRCEWVEHGDRCPNPAKTTERGDTTTRGWGEKARLAEHLYCGRHAPSAVTARETKKAEKRATKMAVREEAARPRVELEGSRADLLAEAKRWRDDEAATGEGFCPEEDHCEHHECRLARAVTRLERAELAIVARRRGELVADGIPEQEAAEWAEEELED